MRQETIDEQLADLFRLWSGSPPAAITRLPDSGSARRYYRINGSGASVIGTYNSDEKENKAFLAFTAQFRKAGLPVPEVFITGSDPRFYLQSDLGDQTLFRHLCTNRINSTGFPQHSLELYKKSLHWLPGFQLTAGRDLDYSFCYPRREFDRQSMLWDLNYFKYYFLKLAGVSFDEQLLEDDFQVLCDFLLQSEPRGFLYRDFQSRNIMIVEDEPYFIDYQGGRRGSLLYDLASLLYDGKADLPESIREELAAYYFQRLQEKYHIHTSALRESYPAFILIRILQALGAYGYRGYFERKSHFLQSIPFALDNLRRLFEDHKKKIPAPYLRPLIEKMVDPAGEICQRLIRLAAPEPSREQTSNKQTAGKLVLDIYSFSYKRGIPVDKTGNGGGFVFDCRALPNPGRYPGYGAVTGRDEQVIEFFKDDPAVETFISNAQALVKQSISNYLSRGFGNLMIAFGCTGGQHRSVYCAEKLAASMIDDHNLVIRVHHTEQEISSAP